MVAWEKAGLKITFHCRREADGSSTVVARFANMCQEPMTSFVFEAAVPKYVRLTMQPATSQVLPPLSETVSQTMLVANTAAGEKALMMRLRIGYVFQGAQVQELGQVANFPSGY